MFIGFDNSEVSGDMVTAISEEWVSEEMRGEEWEHRGSGIIREN